jgi:hypothetical protein
MLIYGKDRSDATCYMLPDHRSDSAHQLFYIYLVIHAVMWNLVYPCNDTPPYDKYDIEPCHRARGLISLRIDLHRQQTNRRLFVI